MRVWQKSGEGTHILGYDREVPWWWSLFLKFSLWFGPYFVPHHDLINPLFLQKTICLSLSHLVPEILGPKVYYLTVFKHCISIFSLIFNLRSFWLLILKNLRSDWVQFFLFHAEPIYWKFGKVSLPPLNALISCFNHNLTKLFWRRVLATPSMWPYAQKCQPNKNMAFSCRKLPDTIKFEK